MKDASEMGFKVYTSEDLVHWTDAGMALKACDSWGEKQFWAPDIVYVDGIFYLSYSVEEHLCIATSRSPLGPFVQEVKKPLHEDIKEIDSHFSRTGTAPGIFILSAFLTPIKSGARVWPMI